MRRSEVRVSILVSGSVALDHIMVFPDRFANHILPDQVHALNVSFNITTLDTHFGGVAGNIAYHLRMLGADPLILSAAGSDFGAYAERLDHLGIRRDGIAVFDDVRTTQGFVTTDREDCQIWAYYEGAMARAHEARVEDVDEPIELAIVSATGKRAMLEHPRALKRRGVPTWIDPSHGLPILSGPELLEMIEGAAGYFANDYEWRLTLDKTGASESEIGTLCENVVITSGAEGSEIRTRGASLRIPAVEPKQVVDPTGCGDAYRAGFLFAIASGKSLDVAGRIGSLLGSWQIEVEGAQALDYDLAAVRARYAQAFGGGL
jgi:adenosine kinase